MEQVNTLDVMFGGRIGGDNPARLDVDGLQKAIVRSLLSLRNKLVAKRVPASPDAGTRVEPLSGYYAEAYQRATAATPMSSTRHLV